jgi:hypothetical protein
MRAGVALITATTGSRWRRESSTTSSTPVQLRAAGGAFQTSKMLSRTTSSLMYVAPIVFASANRRAFCAYGVQQVLTIE